MALNLDIDDEEFAELYEYICTQLGAETVDVDLEPKEINILLRRATKTYLKEIYNWQVVNQFANILGSSATQDFTNRFVRDNTIMAQRYANWFASMARVGGKTEWKKDYFVLENGRQIYNLANESGEPYEPGTRKIHRIMWVSNPPVVGARDLSRDYSQQNLWNFGQSGLSYNNQNLSVLGQMFDIVLLTQSLKVRNKMLFSEFSYNISGDIVELVPMAGGSLNSVLNEMRVYYYYFDEADLQSLEGSEGEANALIANPSQVGISFLKFSSLNDPAKAWIEEYTLALAKYTWASKLRHIKKTINEEKAYEIEFDYDSLLQEHQTDKEALIQELRDFLGKLDQDVLMQKKTEMVENAAKTNRFHPRKFFIG